MKKLNARLAAGWVVLLVLTGCGASRQEVATRLGQQYVGQNVDALVVRFGPPVTTYKLNSGETSYVWQLGNQTNVYANRVVATASTEFCKVNVIASPAGIVTRLTTEDANIGGGLAGAMGLKGSICARRLGMPRG